MGWFYDQFLYELIPQQTGDISACGMTAVTDLKQDFQECMYGFHFNFGWIYPNL